MASPSLPPSLEQLGGRPFSFYPPIVGVEWNEWTYKSGNWSEILVHNPQANIEVWIPRAYIGELSKVDEPMMILGLKREIELKSGSIWPYTRRVLQMPANPVAAMPAPAEEIPTVSVTQQVMGLSGGTESGITKLLAITLAVALTATVAGITLYKLRTTGGTVEYQGVLQAELGFTNKTDYFDVVRKLGTPEKDRWQSEIGERQIRALEYPKSDLIVLLLGADRKSATYIGAKDSQWRTIHAVSLPGGGNTEAILRTIKKF